MLLEFKKKIQVLALIKHIKVSLHSLSSDEESEIDILQKKTTSDEDNRCCRNFFASLYFFCCIGLKCHINYFVLYVYIYIYIYVFFLIVYVSCFLW